MRTRVYGCVMCVPTRKMCASVCRERRMRVRVCRHTCRDTHAGNIINKKKEKLKQKEKQSTIVLKSISENDLPNVGNGKSDRIFRPTSKRRCGAEAAGYPGLLYCFYILYILYILKNIYILYIIANKLLIFVSIINIINIIN